MSRERVVQIFVLVWLTIVYVWLWGDVSIGNILAGLVVGLLIMSSLRLPRVRVDGGVHLRQRVVLAELGGGHGEGLDGEGGHCCGSWGSRVGR